MSGHEHLGFAQAATDFHSHIVVAQISFLGEFGIIEAKHEVLPEEFHTLRLCFRENLQRMLKVQAVFGGKRAVLR